MWESGVVEDPQHARKLHGTELGEGRQRPLGIAALEDKILQSALCEVLNAIYETDFVGFSYGFRPGRNQHQALDAIVVGIRYKKVNWVLDADIRGYFDTIDHQWLQRSLQHRIGDQRVMRLIRKWLKGLNLRYRCTQNPMVKDRPRRQRD